MLESLHLYSAFDLQKARDGSLYDLVNKTVAAGIKHVLSCPLCTSKGFFCEVCQSDQVSCSAGFSFQSARTMKTDSTH